MKKKRFDYIQLEICLENKEEDSDCIISHDFKESADVLDNFECVFSDVEPLFCQHITPTEPFRIQICYNYVNVLRHRTEKIKETNNIEKTFPSECVICLTNPPNLLFCNRGHSICVECYKVKDSETCPICNIESLNE